MIPVEAITRVCEVPIVDHRSSERVQMVASAWVVTLFDMGGNQLFLQEFLLLFLDSIQTNCHPQEFSFDADDSEQEQMAINRTSQSESMIQTTHTHLSNHEARQ